MGRGTMAKSSDMEVEEDRDEGKRTKKMGMDRHSDMPTPSRIRVCEERYSHAESLPDGSYRGTA